MFLPGNSEQVRNHLVHQGLDGFKGVSFWMYCGNTPKSCSMDSSVEDFKSAFDGSSCNEDVFHRPELGFCLFPDRGKQLLRVRSDFKRQSHNRDRRLGFKRHVLEHHDIGTFMSGRDV